MSRFSAASMPSQEGRTVIVTGANTGIGFEIAKAFAERGARVVLACRNQDKAETAIARIEADVHTPDLAFLPLDQADLGSVRAAAELAEKEQRIDLLINNAGVMIPPLSRTVQGHELQFGTNHLGTFALTGLLLPKLAQTPGSRVVVTSSIAHRQGRIDFGNLDVARGYNRMNFYAQSKLANLMFVLELDRRLRAAGSPIAAIGCHPGVAGSELQRHIPFGGLFAPLVGLLLNSAAQGAWPALQAATDPAAQGGDYFGPQGLNELRGPSGPSTLSRHARDADVARRLWDISVELTGIDPGLAPARA